MCVNSSEGVWIMTGSVQKPLPEDTNQRLTSKKQQQKVKKGVVGNVEFDRLEPSDLSGFVHVTAQALDNQWIPRSLLRKALQKGLTASIESQRKKQVRTEYVRALVNSERVVINRAFIYNSQAIFQDFLGKDSEGRKAFKALLEKGVILPWLYLETSPVGQKPVFGVDRGLDVWWEICQEVRTQCVRLSWDDELNSELGREHLARRFHNFAVTASSGNITTSLKDLSLDPKVVKDPSAKDVLRN